MSLFLLSNILQKLQISPHCNVHMAINKCITFLILWNLSCHYLHNHSVDMLGYINVILCKEHSPKMWQIPVGALGIWPLSNLKRLEKWVHWCYLDSKNYSVQLFSCKEQLSYRAWIMSHPICEGIRNPAYQALMASGGWGSQNF